MKIFKDRNLNYICFFLLGLFVVSLPFWFVLRTQNNLIAVGIENQRVYMTDVLSCFKQQEKIMKASFVAKQQKNTVDQRNWLETHQRYTEMLDAQIEQIKWLKSLSSDKTNK